MEKIRTRIAPSPTGFLHLGTARTALFNYLFAKKNKGKFILRFEDTDNKRNTQESEKQIKEGLLWLNLKWDEGPFYQMERLSLYKKAGKKLLKKGFAYFKEGALFLNVLEVLDYFKIPYKKVKLFSKKEKIEKQGYFLKLPFSDLILGEISGVVEDFVLIRKNDIPTYHFAVVVDDEDMKITHVIRGQDHLSNTPKHFLIQKALGYFHPCYAHIPLILAKDGGKLSKRHGAVSVLEYRDEGYLPESLVNFLVLLGWNSGNDREIFTLEELEKIFLLNRVQKSPATFNIEKLNFLNSFYLRKKTGKEILKILRENKVLNKNFKNIDNVYLEKILEVEKSRIQKISDIKNFDFYFKEPKYKPELLIFKKSNKEKTKKGLKAVFEKLKNLKDWFFKKENFEDILKEVTEEEKLNFGDVFWPTRVALSGKEFSPSPAELLWVFGKKNTLKRISLAINLLKKYNVK